MQGEKAAPAAGTDGALRGTLRFYERTAVAVFLVVMLVAVSTYYAFRPTGASVDVAWRAFKATHGRQYASPEEETVRFAIFKRNYAVIEATNAKQLSYTLGVNEFADLTPAEFAAGRFGLAAAAPAARSVLWGALPHLGTDRSSSSGASGAPGSGAVDASSSPWVDAAPSAVDWVAQGAVTPPKQQGQCGACWSFSTTGALEGAWKIATGRLVSLSEQQLVDCDLGNSGCGGGVMDSAFSYLQDQPVCTEDSYPYQAARSTCRTVNCTVAIPKGAVKGFRDVAKDDEAAMLAAVGRGPVSVGIEADQIAFQLYSGGVLAKECGSSLDHGVLVVGFGEERGAKYWKVKNSWGPAWGEGGFIRIERGGNNADGECGINTMPSYPVVEGTALAPSPASTLVV